MDVWGFLGGLVNPIASLIDSLHTSEEERLELKAKMFELQTNMAMQLMDYEKSLLESKAQIITAEATGQSWLQRNWRPGMMVLFGGLVASYWFGYTPENMSQETINNLFTLLQIGIGGYIAGRSVEKVAPKIADIMRKD